MLPLGSPFTRTEYEADLMHAMIKDIHFSQKPIISIILYRKSHFTLSKALLISSLSHKTFFFFFFIWCKVSKATKMLSEITLSN